MKTEFLVLGATGGIGYAVVKALLDQNISTTILVRDYKKAQCLFGTSSLLKVALGDAGDTELLNQLSSEKTHIFHGLNAPFEQWKEVMPSLTKNVINAAEKHYATIIFPANNYNYGSIKQPITEVTPFQPNTDLGRIRVGLETQIKDAARLGRIKAQIVRLPEIWGPNVCNKSFEPVFIKLLQGRPMPWLFNIDTPQQMAYNMDAGRMIVAISSRPNQHKYEVFNYGGKLFSSMRDFLSQLAQAADKPLKVSVMSKGLINMLSKVNSGLKQIKSLEYKFQETILLDDSTFRSIMPKFDQAPTMTAMTETLAWFRSFRLQPASQEKKQKRKAVIIDFMADNLSIGIFPLLISLIGSRFPAMQSMTVLLGVVAGIYWSPLIRKLFRKIAPARKLATALMILALLGLINNPTNAQDAVPHNSLGHFNGFYGKLELGKQNVFSGALIDSIDVLTHEAKFATTLALGLRKQINSNRIVVGTELSLGLIDGDLSQRYFNGQQELLVSYFGKFQTAFGITFGTVLGHAKKWHIYTYGHSTKRCFDISFIEENGFEHKQMDNNTFLRYGLGLEATLSNRLNLNATLGKVYVDFGESVTTQSVTDIGELSIGLVFQLSKQKYR